MFTVADIYNNEKLLHPNVDFVNRYTPDRIQERFKGKTPAEVRAESLAADSLAQYPIPVNKRIQKYKARYAA